MKKLLTLIFAALMFTACTKGTDTFVGKEYKLTNAENNADITLGFMQKDNRFFGKAAVNRYFGTYKLEGESLSFSPAGSTMMMGPRDQMEAEQHYLKAISNVTSYKLDGKKLTIKNADGQSLVFEEIGTVKDAE